MTPFAKFLKEIEPLLAQWGSERRRRVLGMVEWLGMVQGQGTGPHGSGDDGQVFPGCLACGGIHESGSREFIVEAIGHKPTCLLRKMMERE